MRIYGLMIVKWGGGCGCGGKRVGVGSANGLSMEGGWFVKEWGWAALMDSLWGGRRLRLTWGCGVW